MIYGLKRFLRVPLKRLRTVVLVDRDHKRYPEGRLRRAFVKYYASKLHTVVLGGRKSYLDETILLVHPSFRKTYSMGFSVEWFPLFHLTSMQLSRLSLNPLINGSSA